LPWLFAGTGLRNGDLVRGTFGIEIDARVRASPPQTIVVASIPDEFGRGETADMTYYETARGAKVFAAGTLAFGGSAEIEPVATMLENLWERLAPMDTPSVQRPTAQHRSTPAGRARRSRSRRASRAVRP
jgi:hypothetical protein